LLLVGFLAVVLVLGGVRFLEKACGMEYGWGVVSCAAFWADHSSRVG